MNLDDFEHRLGRQPLRELPSAWRAGVLKAALDATDAEDAVGRGTRRDRVGSWWREWLWPSPVAWAGLMAAWVMVAALNFAATERGPRPVIPPAALGSYWSTQQQFMAELLRAPAIDPADVPRGSVRPRSKSPGSSSLKTHAYETVA